MYERKYRHRKVKLKSWTTRDGKLRRVRLHARWMGMLSRVRGHQRKPGHRDYWVGKPVYWRTFDEFREWALANGFSKSNCSLDRRDPDKGYSPDNCEWVTKAEQATRSNARQPETYRK